MLGIKPVPMVGTMAQANTSSASAPPSTGRRWRRLQRRAFSYQFTNFSNQRDSFCFALRRAVAPMAGTSVSATASEASRE